MTKTIKNTLNAKGTEISILTDINNQSDYISLTDIARHRNPDEPKDVVKNWMRVRSTVEFLGLWEQLNNPNFKGVEFDSFKKEAGSNAFTLSPEKWIKTTNAIGIISKRGKNGGTFAHKDIAFEFASWISPEFKLYIIQDYQRLKEEESYKYSLDWNAKRVLSKANYRIHTDAIKENLIPPELSKVKQHFVYAGEADVLNVALFGKTARMWRNENPEKKGNIRDYATIEQLLVLSNMENLNAYLIKEGINQNERLVILNKHAIEQMKKLTASKSVKALESLDTQPQLKSDNQ